MPCSDEDSKDMPYLRAIFAFLESNPSQFDMSRVWAQGFSQNSMFSAYIGFCFSDNVLGVWQGGSGLALTGEPPNLPGCQGQVTASDFATCQANGQNCNACKETNFCDECQYWPIYPCYSPKRQMVNCIMEYTNDGISVQQTDPDKYSTATNMWEAMTAEGHDARLLRFSPSDDGTVKGGHTDPKNPNYWYVGCLGITAPCSSKCEISFLACVESQDVSTAQNRAHAFDHCMRSNTFTGMGCVDDCAPTYNMLIASEVPTTAVFDTFGAGSGSSVPKPSTSHCSMA